jgi:hypothetical protein
VHVSPGYAVDETKEQEPEPEKKAAIFMVKHY